MNKSITVIIPVFEQWELIPDTLDCLAAQNYPMELVEILLVDNGSKRFLPPSHKLQNLRILHCEKRGSYAARNVGVQHADGDLIAFTDADCLPEKNWLSEIARVFSERESEAIFIAGAVGHVNEDRPLSIYEIYDVVRGIPQEHYVRRGYAATANLSVPRRLIETVGMFNELRYSGGDAEFCRRSLECNFRLVYLQSALVNHRTRSSWREIITKARRVKGGQVVCKSNGHRVWIYIRTLLSPVVTIFRLFQEEKFPLRYRLIASLVYLCVWPIELMELVRVSFGGNPERQ